jgi:hypothetical protein
MSSPDNVESEPQSTGQMDIDTAPVENEDPNAYSGTKRYIKTV